jgi:hypothetical protein
LLRSDQIVEDNDLLGMSSNEVLFILPHMHQPLQVRNERNGIVSSEGTDSCTPVLLEL